MSLHEQAVRARDEALSRVEERSAAWRAVAMEALEHVARHQRTLTSDDVWVRLDAMGIGRPIEARAIGPVMLAARRKGFIRANGHFTQGRDPRHHLDVAREYDSLIVERTLWDVA